MTKIEYSKGSEHMEFDVHPITKESLTQMALRHGVSIDEELEQIIHDRTSLEKRIANGEEILVRKPNGRMSQLEFGLKQNPQREERGE